MLRTVNSCLLVPVSPFSSCDMVLHEGSLSGPWKPRLRIGPLGNLCYPNTWMLCMSPVSHISQANYITWKEEASIVHYFEVSIAAWHTVTTASKGSHLLLFLVPGLVQSHLGKVPADHVSLTDKNQESPRSRHVTHTDWKAGDMILCSEEFPSPLLLQAGSQGLDSHIFSSVFVNYKEKTKG